VLLFSVGCSQDPAALHAPSFEFMPPIGIISIMAGRVEYFCLKHLLVVVVLLLFSFAPDNKG
jgi:hypothetical protein